ncbi:hypothetical protein EW026_g493 [Hermanssonia centrifuga]|uniref:Pheromone receptor n=1 Tax=Hermanssonia centrifuga TaxID=98765 RepID=A0A4S4KUY4_9APHY|nr:hypothetical protein EW026_g493 [Hermanssonia centrifuga]
MADPTYPLFPIFAFLGFVLGLVPLPWHLQGWNAGTCIYMFWVSFGSLIQFVDSVVWHGSYANVAPVWCDISTKFVIGAGAGIPAASLCINRRLYNLTSVRVATVTHQEKRRAMYIDMAIGLGIPVIVMALHYVVQGHRFNIAEDIGCLPEIFVTPVTFPLVFMWPVLLGCISAVYAALTLRSFWIRRIQFKEVLSSTNSLSMSRYFRLMLLSSLDIMLTVPLGVYSIYINVKGVEIWPWISWADTHFDFSRVEMIPAFIWRSNQSSVIALEMGRWIYPCAAFLFFSLFGFASEARRHYALGFWWTAKQFGILPRGNDTTLRSNYSAPCPPKFGPSNTSEVLPSYSSASTGHIVLQSAIASAKDKDLDIEKAADSPTTPLSCLMYYQASLVDGPQNLSPGLC